jgi:hypothetical protein
VFKMKTRFREYNTANIVRLYSELLMMKTDVVQKCSMSQFDSCIVLNRSGKSAELGIKH